MSFGISIVYWISLHRHPPVRPFGIGMDILEVDIFNVSTGSKGVAHCQVVFDDLFIRAELRYEN